MVYDHRDDCPVMDWLKSKHLDQRQAKKLLYFLDRVIPEHGPELPRLSRRLQLLRGWSHEQSNEVFSGSTGAGGADGVRAPG